MKNLIKYCLEAYLYLFKTLLAALFLLFAIGFFLFLVFAPVILCFDFHVGGTALLLYLITLPILYYLAKKLD